MELQRGCATPADLTASTASFRVALQLDILVQHAKVPQRVGLNALES